MKNKIGAAVVVGAGVGGMQAALDLADSGIKVYLVDSAPAIGGVMAQLDKTFPTNDCSMCILAPRLVRTGRHPNIEIITNSSVTGVEGDPGNFRVTVHKKARYVDEKLCVGCGDCWEKCPVKKTIPSEFDQGLVTRTAIYMLYPQAIPNIPIIDADNCLHFKTGKCGICAKVCKANAIDFNMKDADITLEAGAIVLSPGYELFQSSLKPELGYDRYPNVVTSLEFERILNASGPYSGKVLRVSDKKHPKKIAFIQCVGSRDIDRNYCSSVCCMYATKEALIAMEHQPGLECTIFFVDMRAFGKGFDAYYDRAKNAGVKYVRCRPSCIKEIPSSRNLDIKYEDKDGNIVNEEFDMVVLSSGLRPPKEVNEMAKIFGLSINEHGFCKTETFTPVESGREGIYVCGPFTEPKDIPETVTQASAAASKALSVISTARGTLVEKKKYPAEKNVAGLKPRIGIFVCHCGTNIAGVINVTDVVEYARNLPNVVFAADTVYACANDSIEKIKQTVAEHDLNRVVVAACTPRTHEPLFRDAIHEAGLNPCLFEMANIRDQGSWVHMKEPQKAADKARDLIRMAAAKSAGLEPLETRTMKVLPQALVIGAGVSGITAALDMAKHGVEVHLVERLAELGGNLRRIRFLLDGTDPSKKLAEFIDKVNKEKKIHVHLNSKITSIEGTWGNFKTTIDENGQKAEFSHGVIIVATGAIEYKPTEYLYGKEKGVVTQLELESMLASGRFKSKTVVMIQCVGSRDDDHPYCSRTCCAQAIKNALKIKETNPDTEVYILYRDIRAYGFREAYYRKARENGVVFIRYEDDKNPVVESQNGGLRVLVTDSMLKKQLAVAADMVVLSTGTVPNPGNSELGSMLKIPLNQDSFFLEAHMKLRPLDFASDGIFLCGLAHSPKDVGECVSQASGAAARASSIALSQTVELDPNISQVIDSKCDGCAFCVDTCPYEAITLLEYMKDGMVKKIIEVNPAMCKGCGVCQATCPKGGVEVGGFKLDQISSMVDVLLEGRCLK